MKKIINIIRIIVFRTLAVLYFPFRKIIKKSLREVEVLENPYIDREKKDLIIDRNFDLSIIVPVYNVEKYLEECIQSLIRYKAKRYKVEYIFINDGSTDNSLKILKKYKNEENFIIIDKENGGVSSARNRGLENSRGKKIMFVDSDDVICNSIDEIIDISLSTDSKITSFDYYTFVSLQNNEVKHNETRENKLKIEHYHTINGYPWGKLYDYQLFESIRFPDYYWYEDTIIQFLVFREVESISCYNKILNGYRINPTSITSKKNKPKQKNIDTIYVLQYCYENYKTMFGIDEYLKKLSLIQASTITLIRLRKLNVKQRISSFNYICDLFENDISTFNGTNIREKLLIKAFKERNYWLWFLCC